MSVIALDYDETYTADPLFWREFMSSARERGHNVFICTYRDDRFDRTDELDFLEQDDFDVVYTRGVAKRFWCEQFGPGKVDVWIDDEPEAILNNSNLSVDGLHVWRGGNKIAASA